METLSWNDILLTFLSFGLTVVSSVLVPMLFAWLKTKIKNEKLGKYADMLSGIVCKAVVTTNQTFVDALKKAGSFDEAAQKAAFELTKATVLKMLNDEAKAAVTELYGDFNTWLITEIESAVPAVKK